MNRNIVIRKKNGVNYDTLYPKTVADQVIESTLKRFVSDFDYGFIAGLENLFQVVDELSSSVSYLENLIIPGSTQTFELSFSPVNISKDAGEKGFVDIEFSPKHYINLLGSAGQCEDINKWTTTLAWLELNSTLQVHGASCIKVNTSGTSAGKMTKLLSAFNADVSKYYLLTAYIANGTATSVSLTKDATGGGVSKTSATVSGTSMTRVALKFQPSDLRTTNILSFNVNSTTTGKVGYIDSIQWNEITSEEYTNDSEATLMTKYPYVRNLATTKNPGIRLRNQNLIRNGNGEAGTAWWVKSSGTGTMSLTSQGITITNTGGQTIFGQRIRVPKYTDLYLFSQIAAPGITASLVIADEATNVVLATNYGSFNSGQYTDLVVGIIVDGTGSANYREMSLIVGNAYQTYESHRLYETYIDGDFFSGDTISYRNGKLSGTRSWRSKMAPEMIWSQLTDFGGYKAISAIMDFEGIGDSQFGINYSGDFYRNSSFANIGTSTDQIAFEGFSGTGRVAMSLLDSATGWSEAISPNSDEIKAFLMGWKSLGVVGSRYVGWISRIDGSIPPMTVNSTCDLAANAKTIRLVSVTGLAVNDYVCVRRSGVWTAPLKITAVSTTNRTITIFTVNTSTAIGDIVMKVDNGAAVIDMLNYCTMYNPTGFTPDIFYYKSKEVDVINGEVGQQLASIKGPTPIMTDGFNLIEYICGYVRDEYAYPDLASDDSGYSFNVYGSSFYVNETKLTYPVEKIVQIYEDDVPKINDWIIMTTNAYGKERAGILKSNYNMKSSLTVDYNILRDISPLIGSAIANHTEGLLDTLNKIVESRNGDHFSSLLTNKRVVDQLSILINQKRSTASPIFNMIGNMEMHISHISGTIVNTQQSNLTYTIDTDASVPVDVGSIIYFIQNGNGSLTIVPRSGVTIRGKTNGTARTVNGKGAVMQAMKTAPNEWTIFGDSKV